MCFYFLFVAIWCLNICVSLRSATWPKNVQRLARDLCRHDPVHVVVGELGLSAVKTISQHVQVVEANEKLPKYKIKILSNFTLLYMKLNIFLHFHASKWFF